MVWDVYTSARIDLIDSLPGLERLRSEWSKLSLECPRATPFQSPQWLVPWTRHLFKGGQIWTLAIRDGTQLIGFAPLFRWGSDRRVVSFLGAGISDYGDLLFTPGRESECVNAVRSFLNDMRNGWDTLDLREVRSGAGLLQAYPAEPYSVCPVLALAPDSNRTGPKHLARVRRAQASARKRYDLQFGFTDNIEDFFPLYEARWGPLDDSLRLFHREVASGFLASRQLRLGLLRINDVPAAAMYTFRMGATLYYYLGGFNAAMAKLSPGAMLLGWIIEQAIAQGLKEVDFLRHPEPYKYLWGARDRVNYRICTDQ